MYILKVSYFKVVRLHRKNPFIYTGLSVLKTLFYTGILTFKQKTKCETKY